MTRSRVPNGTHGREGQADALPSPLPPLQHTNLVLSPTAQTYQPSSLRPHDCQNRKLPDWPHLPAVTQAQQRCIMLIVVKAVMPQ